MFWCYRFKAICKCIELQCRRFKCSSVISWLLEDIVPRVYEHADTALNQDIIALLANRGGVRNPCSKRCENLLLQSLVASIYFCFI